MDSSDTAASIFGLLLMGVLVLLVVACLAFWLWMLIHALTNTGLSGSEKVAWVLVILFVNWVGAVIYFFIGRPKAGQSPGGPP